jgi:tetratricopeptide (TPR) repeat protein
MTLLRSRQTLIKTFWVVAVVLMVAGVRLVYRQIEGATAEQSVQRGLALNKEGQYDAAIQEFTKAIEARPDFLDAYLYRGTALFEAGRPQDSIPDFTRVLQGRTDDAVVYLYRGDSYAAMGSKDAAIADYQRALALATSNEQLAVTARTKLYLLGAIDP